MKIHTVLIVFLILLVGSFARINRFATNEYQQSREDSEKGLTALKKALGRINHILHRPGADYSLLR